MFICVKKVNFISNLFLKYCENIKKFAILRTLGILDHLRQNHIINLKQAFNAYLYAKNQLHHSPFLKILQGNSRLVIFGNMGRPGHTHLKW